MALHSDDSSRVFISYARSDGEPFAKALRESLERAGVPCLQDRVLLEGGRDFWLQITDGIDLVEFLVLVMTPAAMKSTYVRKEWRYARQQGKCVYPVKAGSKAEFDSLIGTLPHWMRDTHIYDLGFDPAQVERGPEWTRFVNDVNTRCEVPRVPFMVEDLPKDFVPRPDEFESLITALLDDKREEPKAITAALKGAGGYGKTTLARALCHDERIQQAFDDGILWVTLGEQVDNLIGKVVDLIEVLSKERPGFTNIDAAQARLAELLADRDILLVIDDVWQAAHLKPFTQGGSRCARLITTRNSDTLPREAVKLIVDAMKTDEALALLGRGLPDGHTAALRKLAARLGEWPLLLKLANGVLSSQIENKKPLDQALEYVDKLLTKRGLTAFDAKNSTERNKAAAVTLGVSMETLSADERARFTELAIFPEDADVPLATVERLWSAQAGLDDIDTEELVNLLFGRSLLVALDLEHRTLRLHDVVRTYLGNAMGNAIPALHGKFLDSYHLSPWAALPDDEPYLWDNLAYHLHEAGRDAELVATVKDGRYLVRKTHLRGTVAVERDLNAAQTYLPTDAALSLLGRTYVNMAHLLNHARTEQEKSQIVHQRMQHLTDLNDCWQSLLGQWSKPYLDLNVAVQQPLPDLPHPALIRTFEGHTSVVSSGVYSPDGTRLLSASDDKKLKVWDSSSGQLLLSLDGHTSTVSSGVYSPDGTRILSTSRDKKLKVWEASSGQFLLSLDGHTNWVNSGVYSPDGTRILSASSDKTLKVWEASSGQLLLTLAGHTDYVMSGVYSPDGTRILSASSDKTLKVWEASSGQLLLTLAGHTDYVMSGVYSPDGTRILSASSDKTLKVWEASSGQLLLTLAGHTDLVRSGVYSPDGRRILSASDDKTLKVWEASSGQLLLTLAGHTDWVRSGVYSPDGTRILSTSRDKTLKVWDSSSRQFLLSLDGHTNWVNSGVYSPDGTRILSASSDKTLKVWEASSGQLLLTLAGHISFVMSGVYSPDGILILSASGDKTLKVWDATAGICLTTFYADSPLRGCAWHPDGEHIIAVGDKGIYWLRWVE